MADNGIFGDDDWGDSEDFFNQIDQFVLQHRQPDQVTGRQSASPRHHAGGQTASVAGGRYHTPQLQLSQPPSTPEQARAGQPHASNHRESAPAWPAYRPSGQASAAQAELARPGVWQGPPQAAQNGYSHNTQQGRGVPVHRSQPLKHAQPQPLRHAPEQQQPQQQQQQQRGGEPQSAAAWQPAQPPPVTSMPGSLLAAQLAGPEALPELRLDVTLSRLQQEKDALQRQVSEREGQAKVLRAKVEQVEREKRELQTRIAQGSQGGMAAFQAQELQRQLDIARQNLAHKDQEADEMVRRNKDRDERLKALLAEAATLSAETKRLEQQRAQLEAELAEAHRERRERGAAAGSASAAIASPARAQRKSLSPRNWQPTGSQGFGQAPGKQKPSSQTRRQHSGTAASSAPAKQPVAQGSEAVVNTARGALRKSSPRGGSAMPAWDTPSWLPIGAPWDPGASQTLWQRLSSQCAPSLASLIAPQLPPEGTRELGAWGPAMSSVSRAACSLSWGASNGLPLLLSMCRLLGACVGQLSHQEEAVLVQALPALLSVSACLLQCCPLTQTAGVASCAAADEHLLEAAGHRNSQGRIQLGSDAEVSSAQQAALDRILSRPGVLSNAGDLSTASVAQSIRSLTPDHGSSGRGLLALLLGLLQQSWPSEAARQAALRALAHLVAAVPAASREAFAPIIISGVLEGVETESLLFLELLHLLLESSAICALLEKALAAPQQGAHQAAPPEEQQAAGPLVAGDGLAGWTSAWNIFRTLNACLSLESVSHHSHNNKMALQPDAAYEVPRAAMAILALLLGSGRPGLLLPLLSEELRGPSCVQQLVLLAGACADGWPHQQPLSSEEAARAWHERLRLAQEALTLLRGLSVQPLLKDLVLESHTSSAASTRACLTTAGAIAMRRPLRHTAGDLAGTLPLASWAHAVGASSVMRSVLGSELQGPVPTASVEDVVHLAKGLMRRVQNYAPQLMES